MGFGRGHTKACMAHAEGKRCKEETEDVRRSLLGNSFHTPTVAWLVDQAIAPFCEKQPLTPEEISGRLGIAPGAMLRSGRQCPLQAAGFRGAAPSIPEGCLSAHEAAEEERALVRILGQQADHKGRDVRIDIGELMKPTRWPRRSISPLRWRWRVALSTKWSSSEHINAQGVLAFGLAVKWRLRSQANVKTRFIHLQDSQVSPRDYSERQNVS